MTSLWQRGPQIKCTCKTVVNPSPKWKKYFSNQQTPVGYRGIGQLLCLHRFVSFRSLRTSLRAGIQNRLFKRLNTAVRTLMSNSPMFKQPPPDLRQQGAYTSARTCNRSAENEPELTAAARRFHALCEVRESKKSVKPEWQLPETCNKPLQVLT